MAINESFTDVTSESTSAIIQASSEVSDIIVDGDYVGTVFLEQSRPSAGVWHVVAPVKGKVSFPVATPDNQIDYRFRVKNIEGTANVYMGP